MKTLKSSKNAAEEEKYEKNKVRYDQRLLDLIYYFQKEQMKEHNHVYQN